MIWESSLFFSGLIEEPNSFGRTKDISGIQYIKCEMEKGRASGKSTRMYFIGLFWNNGSQRD